MSLIPVAVVANRETASDLLTASSQADVAPATATNSLIILLASAFGNGLNYLFAIYFARVFGPVEFGLYALGITVFNIAVLFAPLSMETAVMKFVSQRGKGDGIVSVHRTIASGIATAAGFGVLLALGLMFSADLLADRLFAKPQLSTVLLVLALGIPFAAISTVLLSSLQAVGQIRSMVMIRNGVEPAGKFLLAGLAVSMGWGIHGLVGAVVAILVVSCAVSFRRLRSLTEFQFEGRAIPGSLETKAMLAFSMPLVISNLFGIIAPRSDMLVIGTYLPSQDVAVYAAAFQTAAVLALILSAFDAAIMHTTGELLARQEFGKLRSVSKSASCWAFTLSLFVYVQLLLFAGDILRLFGPAFETGAACLVILALGHLFASAAVSATGIVLMSGRSKTIMLNSIVIGIMLMGSNLLLVPRFGIVGAALGTSLCVAANSLLCVIEAKYAAGIIPYSTEHLKPTAAAVLSVVAGYLLTSAFAGANPLLLASIVGAIYISALLGFGFDENDRQAVTNLYRQAEPMARGLFSRVGKVR
jgi:O-antigen/teichoic acid export membrane protein